MIELTAISGKIMAFFLLRWIRKLVSRLMLFSVIWVIIYAFLPPPGTALMLYRWSEKDYSIDKDWVSLSEISPNIIKAVISSEDQRFINHWGFDFRQIKKAVLDDNSSRGASTISQQVAKNVFLWPARNWVRKGLEVWFTVLLEIFWTKERTLQIYLNVAEMGKGIYGVEAASRIYFDKPASKLNPYEAAMLAATLPSPLKNNPHKPTAALLARQAHILRAMSKIPAQYYKPIIDASQADS